MATQGKCISCRVRFVFATDAPYYKLRGSSRPDYRHLKYLACPWCGGPLARTSEQSRLPEVVADPVVRTIER